MIDSVLMCQGHSLLHYTQYQAISIPSSLSLLPTSPHEQTQFSRNFLRICSPQSLLTPLLLMYSSASDQFSSTKVIISLCLKCYRARLIQRKVFSVAMYCCLEEQLYCKTVVLQESRKRSSLNQKHKVFSEKLKHKMKIFMYTYNHQ